MNYYKAIFFDLNGTVIDIWTDETRDDLYRTVANLLNAYGVPLSADAFRSRFYELMKLQRSENPLEHPEFDVQEIFRTILREDGTPFTRSLPQEILRALPRVLAETFRAASLLRLSLYPGVREVLEKLRKEYRLAVVSDAQTLWAESELRRLDLMKYFPFRVISGALGCRKPAPLLFETALAHFRLSAGRVLFVGNDTYRDIYGAGKLGFRTVWFRSNQGDQKGHGVEPDYIIYHFSELTEAVRFLENKAKNERRIK